MSHLIRSHVSHRSADPPPTCSVIPPDLLARIAAEGAAEDRAVAVRALAVTAAIRARR